MARIKLVENDGEIIQTCKKCGSDNVECWYWGIDSISEFNNNANTDCSDVEYIQHWDCWDCNGWSAGFFMSEMGLTKNNQEWVALEEGFHVARGGIDGL